MIDVDALKKSVEGMFEADAKAAEQIGSEAGAVFEVQNLSIVEFCELFRNDSGPSPLEVLGLEFNPPLPNNEILIKLADDEHSYVFSAVRNTMVPYVRDSDVMVEYKTVSKKVMENGFVLILRVENYGLFCFIPYKKGKKIYGYFLIEQEKNEDGTKDLAPRMKFFMVGECEATELVPTAIKPSASARAYMSPLSQADIIMCSNTSPKFRKQADKWGVLGDALYDLDEFLFNTIDPSYMYKIMHLNNILCFSGTENEAAPLEEAFENVVEAEDPSEIVYHPIDGSDDDGEVDFGF